MPEYLIVDPFSKTITAHKLVRGRYTSKVVKQGTWKSTTFAGLSIPMSGIRTVIERRST